MATFTTLAYRTGRTAGQFARHGFYGVECCEHALLLRNPRAQQLREIHRAAFKLREYGLKLRQQRVSYPTQLRLLPSPPTAPISRLATPFQQRPLSLSSPFFHETVRSFGDMTPRTIQHHHSYHPHPQPHRRSFHDGPNHLRTPGSGGRGSGGKYGGPASGVVQPKPGGADPTDIFKEMNVSSEMPPPSGGVDRLYDDGFLLNSGVEIHGAGVLILQNEAFRWTGLETLASAEGGVLDCDEEIWGALEVVAPKPGANNLMMSERTRSRIHNLGIRVDAMDTRNAAAEFNLLATERSGENVAAAFFPLSFR